MEARPVVARQDRDGLLALVAGLPAATSVWLGGSAACELPRESLPARCAVLLDGAQLEQRLELLPG